MTTHSHPSVTADTGQYPLVTFSHGLSFPALLYQNVTEDLASHGFVVLAINHPGGAAIEYSSADPLDTPAVPRFAGESEEALGLARIAAVWSADIREVLDRLAELQHRLRPEQGGPGVRMDVSRMGLLGHSMGGSAAAHLTGEPRVAAVALMEGKYRDTTGSTFRTVRAPLMHLIGEYNRLELENRDYRPSAGAPVYQVVISGTGHAYFSDLIHIYRRHAPPDWHQRHRHELATDRILQITRDYLAAFFTRFLRGGDSDLLHPVGYAARVAGPRLGGYSEVTLTIDVP